jgi:5-methyltetrahydrofolate--homocysteine methyltransferase
MAELAKLYEAVLNGDNKAAVAVTREALAENVAPSELISEYITPAMGEVGRRFDCEDYFVPQLLLAARAMRAALELIGTPPEPVGRVVIGTVRGDLHDIGKNLVASMFQGGGFEVIDLGYDVTPERFVEAAQQKGADIVALSALLTVTMPAMKTTIQALEAAGVRDRVKVLIGGAPVTQEYAEQIGADGYGSSAAAAVPLARRVLGK